MPVRKACWLEAGHQAGGGFWFHVSWAAGIPTDHVFNILDRRTRVPTTAPIVAHTTARTPVLLKPLGCSTNYPCQNGGTCEQGICVCKNGFIGRYCEDIRVLLNCEENQMTVLVMKDVFVFYGTPTSVLHLNHANCKLAEVTLGGHIYMFAKLTHVNRTDCGTQVQVNGSHLIYSNQIQADLPLPTGMVVRSSNVSINFSCIFEYEKIASLPYSISAQQMEARCCTEQKIGHASKVTEALTNCLFQLCLLWPVLLAFSSLLQ
ncbi:zona pellucida sperm-binding protein 1-like isoform X2 [Pleurodeles waltl]|uniref:zona pellucida sperm-binding protein 1-like isoform X2 n=1 Tax=Pleurodeles waltl TaxID=8319 RepID=UPI003709A9BA